MLTNAAVAGLLVLGIASQALGSNGIHDRAEAVPVSVRSQVRVWGADGEHVRLVRWAAGRFERAGLGAPRVEVRFHPDTSSCYGHLGSSVHGRVDVCVMLVSEIARETLLHEMGHAWIEQHVSGSVRERFLELRNLRVWLAYDVSWDERGFEHAAEIIAWGLGNRYIAPTIPDREPGRLAEGFALLTGIEPTPERD